MLFRTLTFSLIGLLFTACVTEPEPNEFTKLRQDMQKHRERMFASSVDNMQKNKAAAYQVRQRPSIIDPDIELKLQQEEERKRWLAVGIDQDEAEDWKALNLSPKNAVRWKKTDLSYSTIAALLKQDVTPSEAIAFMSQTFDKRPKAFGTFAQPLYDFDDNCKKILDANYKDFSLINKRCKEYNQRAALTATSGYLADEYQDTDLSLEYISKLRQMDNEKIHIASLIEKQSHDSMVYEKRFQFELLFPMVERSPTKEEMYFVAKHKLDVKDSKRFKSNKYYSFWINKEKEEKAARIKAIKQQQALKEAKILRKKAEAYRMKALAYNKMVSSECGDIVSSHPSTGEKVHVEGKVLYFVGKRGSNIFAYVVKNNKDGKNYLVRDPQSRQKVKKGQSVTWIATTVGRVVSITIEEDGTASYNSYEDETEQLFPLLKFSSVCPYRTKSLVAR
jgi:hypothetical protein